MWWSFLVIWISVRLYILLHKHIRICVSLLDKSKLWSHTARYVELNNRYSPNINKLENSRTLRRSLCSVVYYMHTQRGSLEEVSRQMRRIMWNILKWWCLATRVNNKSNISPRFNSYWTDILAEVTFCVRLRWPLFKAVTRAVFLLVLVTEHMCMRSPPSQPLSCVICWDLTEVTLCWFNNLHISPLGSGSFSESIATRSSWSWVWNPTLFNQIS